MKAILVIDVPDKYSDKDIYALHEIYTYEGNRYERIEEYKEGLHKLKPLPRKNQGKFWHNGIGKENTYVCGWNACIDEILGETE